MHCSRTNDQFSLTDQLELGARLLELDTHWVLGELRLAHCGGVRIPMVDEVVKMLDWVASKFGGWVAGSAFPFLLGNY